MATSYSSGFSLAGFQMERITNRAHNFTSGQGLPIFVTTPGARRHEVVLLPNSLNFMQLGNHVVKAVTSSVNCASTPDTSSHRSKGPETQPGRITAMRIRWANSQQEAFGFPKLTVLTPENFGTLLEMLDRRQKAGKWDCVECEFSNWRDSSSRDTSRAREDGLPRYSEVWGEPSTTT